MLRKLIILLFISMISINLVSAVWWNNSWDYKKPINVSVSSGSTQTNYQVKLNVTYDSDMQNDFDDLRFVNGSENTELDYWIEEKVNSSWAMIWVKIDQEITTTNYIFYMYYGNSEVNSISNGDNTFEFFDDFPGNSINTTKWSGDNVGVSVSNSILTIDHSAGWDSMSTVNFYNAPYGTSMEFYWFRDSAESGSNTFGYSTDHAHQLTTNYIRIYTNYDSPSAQIVTSKSGSKTQLSATGEFAFDAWKHIKITREENKASFYQENSELSNSPIETNVPTINLPPTISTYTDFKADWIFVRKYTDPEPTYIIGSEEESIPEDTCTCPGAGNDWEINMSDYCNITADCDLTTGTLSFTGSGITRINSTIKTTNLGDPGANGILKILSNCLIWVKGI